MQLRMWTYDLAREQAPTLEHLFRLCELTEQAGYNAIGLYLEHRFAYPSAPWAAGTGAMTPEMAQEVIQRFPNLQIIPFINLLGHFEGMIYSEEGVSFAAERFNGMQADPTNPAFVEFAERIIDDTLAIFPAEIIHIGGDETFQLGRGPGQEQAVKSLKEEGVEDPKGRLYGRHFGPLAEKVLRAGRRPAVWGDMFFEHPAALQDLPKETLIFDWQYFKSPLSTAKTFLDAGHEVVLTPTLFTYNATWLHLPQSERNIREHVDAARDLNAHGVCVATWECELLGNYEVLQPAIRAAGKMLSEPPEPLTDSVPDATPAESLEHYSKEVDAPIMLREYLRESERHEEWARLMGVELQQAGGMFAFGGIRSALKCRLLLYSNPFLLWLRNREDILGKPGELAYQTAGLAIAVAPNAAYRGVSELLKISIEFVRFTEDAHLAYADHRPGEAIAAISPCRTGFDELAKIAKATQLRIGGSLADIERCQIAKEQVERVIRRVKMYGDGSLGYLPSFETLTHPKFVPHDQGNWWLINDWANE